MKKLLKQAIPAFLLLIFLYACRNEENPAPANSKKMQVEKIVVTDLRTDVITTMQFQYTQDKVQTIKWNFYSASAGVNFSYSENRFYSANGALDSLTGNRFNGSKWNLAYEYKNGLRYKITSKKGDRSSTTTFVDYSGTRPAQVENLYEVYGVYEGFIYPQKSTLKFDDSGNLTSQKHTGLPGYPDVVQEKEIVYGTEPNPLWGLLETPLPQLFEFYDDLGFYYSTNLPTSVKANYPFVDPIHNRIVFEYKKDIHGRVILIKALSPDDESKGYSLEITYL
jgi:hypothetical protein